MVLAQSSEEPYSTGSSVFTRNRASIVSTVVIDC